jgi:hypothetical protein
VGANRKVATAAEATEEGPLGLDGHPHERIVDGGEGGGGRGVAVPALDGERTLGHLREHDRRLEHLGGHPVQAEAVQGGGGHDESAADGDLAQAGGDVAADAREAQVGADRRELGPAADRTGGDGGTLGEHCEADADQGVAGVAALGVGGDHQTGGRGRGKVLGRVHSQVRPAVEHRLLHLLDEHALTTELPDGHVLVAVAGGLGDHQLDDEVGARRPQATGDGLGLPPCQCAPTGCDSQHSPQATGGHSSPPTHGYGPRGRGSAGSLRPDVASTARHGSHTGAPPPSAWGARRMPARRGPASAGR